MWALGLIPAVIQVLGSSTYLGAMVTVFGYPGQRFGQMAEALFLIFTGTAFGLAYSILGLYLSSLVYGTNISAAYAIRAVFFALAVIFHGILRSSTPRLFLFVFFYLLITLTVLTTTATVVSATIATQISYPILTALAAVLLINVAVFPESSSGFLGNTVIETLHDTTRCLEDAVDWFATARNEMTPELKPTAQDDTEKGPEITLRTRLISLTDRKPKLRAKFAGTKKAQGECNFEVVYTVLPPESLKPISMTSMSRLVQTTISVVNACESKYAMLGEDQDTDSIETADADSHSEDSDSSASSDDSDQSSDIESSSSSVASKSVRHKSKHIRNLELVKPIREIESGDIELFDHIVSQVRGPSKILQHHMHEAVDLITCSLAYCYDVAKLPSGARAPSGITLEEIDLRIKIFAEALIMFDKNSAEALEHAAAIAYRGSQTGGEKDINAVPDDARKAARAGRGDDKQGTRSGETDSSTSNEKPFEQPGEEVGRPPHEQQVKFPFQERIPQRKGLHNPNASTALWLRGLAADVIEFVADSDDLAFALKMSVAGWLITWPAFVPSLNAWYVSMRASWATLQLILVFEVSVGTSIQGFLLRVIGVIYGCVAGFLSYRIGQGNRVVVVVVLVIASLPAAYTHLGTPYVKTGIISIVSMSVVGLASTVSPDAYPWEIFLKRMICFLIGGTIALIVELVLFPVRARDRLVESLASAIQQISNMEASVAIGIETPKSIDLQSETLNANFHTAKEKAEAALTAAQTFLPFTLTEPRLKGSFTGQAMIYNEMIYVLHQIIDRMDHVLHIRKVYGSSVLEELNEFVLPYRRNMAASITLTLFAVHEALTTRLPLPQFLPSSRVAHLRYVSRVREVMFERNTPAPSRAPSIHPGADSQRSSRVPEENVLKSVTKQKFLSWNAGSAGMIEIIEYLEELVDLAKLLVGVNAFRTGMLERPKFHEYIAKIKARELRSATAAETEQTVERIKSNTSANIRRRRGYSSGRADSQGTMSVKRTLFAGRMGADAAVDTDSEEDAVDELPMSLQRVRTRRMEEQKAERARRASLVDPKGKGVLRKARTFEALV
ncbi:hypothetical protein TruAng_004529 [Truncatella angustata]|nr:hypothetical protein TruAng_004529 [Truncatella angustata]